MELGFLARVTLLGLFAGVIGTGGGGLIALSFRSFKKSTLSLVLGFSAGIMLVVIFMELLEEGFDIGGFGGTFLGLSIGIVVLYLLDIYFPHQHFSSKKEGGNSRFLKAGILLSIGIALHNIPEGLAIGAGYAAYEELGIGLAIIMAVQNIPEGIAMATTLSIAKVGKGRIFLATVLAGLPMGVGAWIGGYVGSIAPTFLSFALGFAAGAMLYIVCDELIPDAHEMAEKGSHTATMGIVGGVLIGLLLEVL